MRVFSLSDLHLSGSVPTKAMDIFGPQWRDHAGKIAENWRRCVSDDDVVVVAGDISWAMTLEEAASDLLSVGALPGKKILFKGNHDFWWSSIGRLRRMLPEGLYAVQNDCVTVGGVTFAGTRGWLCPQSGGLPEEDLKIYRREAIRLEMSLKAASGTGCPVVGAIHFPPFNEKREPSDFTRLFEEHGVGTVVYGHLHGPSIKYAFEGEMRGTRYVMTSCDAVDFTPKLIAEF